MRNLAKGVRSERQLPSIATALVAAVLLLCACGARVDGDWRGQPPAWPTPLETRAQVIEAAKYVSILSGEADVAEIDRGSFSDLRAGVGRVPDIPLVEGRVIDDVWRVTLESGEQQGTFVFHAPTGILLEAVYRGL